MRNYRNYFNYCADPRVENQITLDRYREHKTMLSAPESPSHLKDEYSRYALSHPSYKSPISFGSFLESRERDRREAVPELDQLIKDLSQSIDREYDSSGVHNAAPHYASCLGLEKHGINFHPNHFPKPKDQIQHPVPEATPMSN